MPPQAKFTKEEIIESAKALYKEYVNKGLTEEHPFKGVLPLIEESMGKF